MIKKAQWQNDSPSSFARTAPRAWWVGIRWPRTWRQLSTAEQSSGEYQHLHYSFCQIRLWVLVSICFLLLLAPFSSKKMVGDGGRGRVGGIQNAVQVKVLGDSLRASQMIFFGWGSNIMCWQFLRRAVNVIENICRKELEEEERRGKLGRWRNQSLDGESRRTDKLFVRTTMAPTDMLPVRTATSTNLLSVRTPMQPTDQLQSRTPTSLDDLSEGDLGRTNELV